VCSINAVPFFYFYGYRFATSIRENNTSHFSSYDSKHTFEFLKVLNNKEAEIQEYIRSLLDRRKSGLPKKIKK